MNTSIKSFTNESLATVLNENEGHANLVVELVGFCHNIRIAKKMIFVVLRRELNTVQLIIFKKECPDIYSMFANLGLEATVHVMGTISRADIKSCTVTEYEIIVTSATIINGSLNVLPFHLDDANESFCADQNDEKDEQDEKENTPDQLAQANAQANAQTNTQRIMVDRRTRLDNRWLELRTPINQHIFRLRSSLEACIRNVLIDNEFVEIHTPKIVPAMSEGGSNVFSVNYYDRKAFLAQSPQLYKQMMINGGFDRVFEIGPVFRAENSRTYRHLCEFTGLDMEFVIDPNSTHIDIINMIWKVLYDAFNSFENRFGEQIKYVLSKTGASGLVFPKDPVLIDFKEGVRLLNEAGIEQAPHEDIGTINEKKLGSIIKTLYGDTDVYVLINYPNSARPFYTMHEDVEYSRSFDFMMRCNEISSGAQRVHDPAKLKDAVARKGIKLDGTSGLEDYVRSFETGSLPHGGCGIGIERLVMLYLGLGNIRTTSLFPRDRTRISP